MWRQEDLFFAGMGGADPVGTPVSYPRRCRAGRESGRAHDVSGRAADARRGAARDLDRVPAGRAVVLVRKFDPTDVIETASREGANSLSIVGDAMARPIAEALAGPMKGTDLSSVFAISSAGAILSKRCATGFRSCCRMSCCWITSAHPRPASRAPARRARVPDAGLKFTVNARTTRAR